jgi:hypothetical protein
MTTLSLEPRRSWPRDRVLAVAASVVAHLAFLVLLLAHLGSALPRDETPPMEVTLVAPWQKSPLSPASAARPSTHTAPATTQPKETRPEPALAPPPAQAPAASPTPAPNLGAALRGRLGCDHASLVDLSPAERQRCQDRFAKAPEPGAAKPLDLSCGGAIVERSREPFLARTPHNGCVPNLDQKERSLLGVSRSDWSTGVKCAWSF